MPAGAVERESDMDRSFTIAMTVSLIGHALIIGAQGLTLLRLPPAGSARPTTVIYDMQPAARRAPAPIEPSSRLLDHATHVGRLGGAQTGASAGEERRLTEAFQQRFSNALQSAMESSGRGGASAPAASGSGAWAGAIDLTNLESAAHGNPVRLSYFGAVRQQIQRAANRGGWLAQTSTGEGTVYVGVVLDRSGQIRSSAVLPDRTKGDAQLQEAALTIIQSSGPFPSFPPSFSESSLSLIIPIEFVRGS